MQVAFSLPLHWSPDVHEPAKIGYKPCLAHLFRHRHVRLSSVPLGDETHKNSAIVHVCRLSRLGGALVHRLGLLQPAWHEAGKTFLKTKSPSRDLSVLSELREYLCAIKGLVLVIA